MLQKNGIDRSTVAVTGTLLALLLSVPLSPAELRAPANEIRCARLLKPASLPADITALAKLPGRTSSIYRGAPGESQFNLHSYLAFFDGRFWAMWSSSKIHEEDPDQHVKFATSKDGHAWSEARVLVADPDGPSGPARWIARGFFVYGGKLNALAAYITSADYQGRRKGQVVWRDLRLMRFQWDGNHWSERGVMAEGCMNNFPPARVGARWMMACRDEKMRLFVALNDKGPFAPSWSKQMIAADPPFDLMDEPSFYEAPDRTVHLIIRDNSHSGYLIHAVSRDGGTTFSKPVLTNYPDAGSKNFVGRLSDKRFFLVNNPNPKRRDPLAISFSDDGWTYDALRAVRDGATPPRFNQRPGVRGSFQYPHAIEHGGSVWIAYSTNKEDIEITELSLKDIPQ
jgi:hypothetical protein